MIQNKIEKINNPIIYIFLSLAISCVCYALIEDYRRLSIFIAAFFLLFIFIQFDYKFLIIIILFFMCGIFINSVYYSIPNNIYGTVRINKISSFNIIGDYKGKKILLDIKDKNLSKANIKEGERYYINGTVNKKCDKFSGVVGEVTKINSISMLKQDFISKLYSIKFNIHEKLVKNLGGRKAGLISSISFGYSKTLDAEDKEDMKNFGIIHSVCVSGLHVVIIYGFLRLFLGTKAGLLVTIIYVIFTGANYSSIRAYIMLLSAAGSEVFMKNKNSVSSLCLSGLILTIYKPYSIFEISFHLSYLATLGIILLNKKINDELYKLPNKIRESISLALSAQVFTFPYLLIVFNEFSVNFIMGNLLLIPFVNILVILGNTLLVFYKIPFIFDYISYLLLVIIKIFDFVINKIDSYSLPSFYGNSGFVLFYIFLLISIYFIRRGHKEFKYLPIIAAIVAISTQIYSPFIIINYYKSGAISVFYKSEKVVLSNKGQIDMEKLLRLNNTSRECRDFNKIYIDNICSIKPKNKDYELNIGDKKYLLKMSSSKNVYKDYDIINFKEGCANKIYIINNKVIKSF